MGELLCAVGVVLVWPRAGILLRLCWGSWGSWGRDQLNLSSKESLVLEILNSTFEFIAESSSDSETEYSFDFLPPKL